MEVYCMNLFPEVALLKFTAWIIDFKGSFKLAAIRVICDLAGLLLFIIYLRRLHPPAARFPEILAQ